MFHSIKEMAHLLGRWKNLSIADGFSNCISPFGDINARMKATPLQTNTQKLRPFILPRILARGVKCEQCSLCEATFLCARFRIQNSDSYSQVFPFSVVLLLCSSWFCCCYVPLYQKYAKGHLRPLASLLKLFWDLTKHLRKKAENWPPFRKLFSH